MVAHPSEEDCDWLLEELAALLDRLGPEHFLAGPIVEPSARFFPDLYETEAGAVRIVGRRLLHWAHRELAIEVDMDHAPDPARHIVIWRVYGHPVQDGTLHIDVAEVGRPEHLAGALADVVSRAIRSHEELDCRGGTPYRGGREHNEEELEVQLSTLTAVPLGFGLLALGAAERHHTGGGIEGNWQSFEVATERHGGLSPADLAFLLAAQLVVRDYEVKDVKRLAHHVPANARKLLMDWFNALSPRRDALIETLGLPEQERWPETKAAPETPVPFPIEPPADLAHPERDKRNWRRPVFRVPENQGVRGATFAALFGLIFSIAVRTQPMLAVAFVGVLTSIGYFFGRRMTREVCSDPGCGRRIVGELERCDGCGGVIAGRITSGSKRLEAEDRLPASFWREHDLDPPDDLDG